MTFCPVKPDRELPVFWLTFGGAAVVTFLSCWIGWAFFISPMNETVKTGNRMKEAFVEKLGITPRIMANAGAIFAQSAVSDQLVTSQREGTIHMTFDGQAPAWPKLELKAHFKASAGVFTRETIQFNIRRGGRIAEALIPEVKILSLEIENPEVETPAGFSWDQLPEKAQERVEIAFKKSAKKQLISEGFLEDAKKNLKKSFEEIARISGCEVKF